MAKDIQCRGAVSWGPKQPLKIETITVAAPRKNEVRVKLIATGVCHTDWFTIGGSDPEGLFPCVFGHEGAGIVESIGPDVTTVQVGDHVILLYTPECGNCKFCKNPKTNLCQRIRSTQGAGVMPDGTSRFTCNGKELKHYMGCSTFCEYTVVADISVVKINDDAPLETVCLLACGVTTGLGAVRNTSKVEKGSTVGVWGLGCVGLACIMEAKRIGASQIIAVDINPDKFEKAREFGATHCVNPRDLPEGMTLVQKLVKLSDGGLDYTFECVGRVETMRDALESCHKGWGESCIIGVAGSGQEISTRPFQLVTGRVWRGTAFGGVKSRSELPGIVDEYMNGQLDCDAFLTRKYKLDDINSAFEDMISGKNIRGVIVYN